MGNASLLNLTGARWLQQLWRLEAEDFLVSELWGSEGKE